MVVRDGKDFGAACLAPDGLLEVMTLGAVAIAAGVVGDDLVAALVAAVHVPAQGGGAAQLDGAHRPPLFDGHRGTVYLPIALAVFTKDIGHFQRRLVHGHSERLYFGQAV